MATAFTSIVSSLRLHAGDEALENLPREMRRIGAQRALVVCGNSVATKTALITRLEDILGDKLAGVFSSLRKDAPLEDVQACAQMVRETQADLLIAVGAGSVLKGVRVVAILAAEDGPVQDLATQFPPGAPPVSPRLMASKMPIMNVVTAATSAQNRAGSALHNPDGGPRLEFFDPKTRPVAIFWDSQALLTAPTSLALNTGLSIFWRALMNIGALHKANPLVHGSRLHAFDLAYRNLPLMSDGDNAQARLEMCAAALLQNRDEEDGGRPFDAHMIAKSVYGLGAALFNRVRNLEQGVTHVMLTYHAILQFADLCAFEIAAMGIRLGMTPDAAQDPELVAVHVRDFFAQFALPKTLSEQGVQESDLEVVINNALHNFNANRDGQLTLHRERLVNILRQSF